MQFEGKMKDQNFDYDEFCAQYYHFDVSPPRELCKREHRIKQQKLNKKF